MDNQTRIEICALAQQLGAAAALVVIEQSDDVSDLKGDGDQIDLDDAFESDFDNEIRPRIPFAASDMNVFQWIEAIYHAAFWNEIKRIQASTTPGELFAVLSAESKPTEKTASQQLEDAVEDYYNHAKTCERCASWIRGQERSCATGEELWMRGYASSR